MKLSVYIRIGRLRFITYYVQVFVRIQQASCRLKISSCLFAIIIEPKAQCARVLFIQHPMF